MLSYQHGYHAGCFADVLKHTALTQVLAYLIQKDKPLFYLETHAGKGLYDLKDKQAEKTGEYKTGIQTIWDNKAQMPSEFNEYLSAISELNPKGLLKLYPGSPSLAIRALREQDRIYLCELHPNEFEQLQQIHRKHKKIFFSNSDGIASLKALLPPTEKRGLVFIDPSYEVKDDYKLIPKALKQVYSHFSQGVFCLWYPVIDKKITEQLIRGLTDIGATKTLRIELNLTSTSHPGMTGTGLWLINPPYTLAKEMERVLKTLCSYFNPGESSYLIEDHSA